MNRPTMLFQALLTQVSMELGVSTERDFAVLRNRFEHEGLSFLTITLPKLCDSLEEGLEVGRFTLPNGFKPFRRNGTLPAFLQGLFNRVFDEGGNLLDEACAESILWIRQVTRFFKKPKLLCSPARMGQAVSRFKQVEESLYHATKDVNRTDEILDSVSAILWPTVFNTVDHSSILCGHGPGVTADRLLPNERNRIRYWYTRAEGSFSAADHAFHNWNAAVDTEPGKGLGSIAYRDIREEPGVRVVFVPKTLQTPRVIAIEPSTMQFMQQGLSRWMVGVLESHWLTAGSVNFTDQTINQSLAYSASIDRSLATIDLSDASDRVHLELVQRIFRRSAILESLEDLRSLHADLPDGSNLVLKKYASMGSALCFPVEACVFYTLILSAIFRSTGQRPNYRSIRNLMKVVKVYGDDLIVPVEHVDSVCDYLESYALRVNRRKTFSNSAFRESCGADFYNGNSVNPIYARMDTPARRSQWTPEHVMSWTATANLFYERGWWIATQAVRDMVSSVVVKQIPISRHFNTGICFASYFQERNLVYDQALNAWKQRRLVFTPLKQKDEIDGDYTACYMLSLGKRVSDLRISEEVSSSWTRDRYLSSQEPQRPFKWSRPHGERFPSETRNGNGYVEGRTQRVGEQSSYNFSGRSLFSDRPGESTGIYSTPRRADEIHREIDFHSTVKRGVFKPKRRWITIVS